MTDIDGTTGGGAPREEEHPATGPVIRDKRRIDPETGKPRTPEASEDAGRPDAAPAAEGEAAADDVHPDTALAAERLEEMRRMQAEFVNFRNRTQREREADRDRAVSTVIEALLPVMDDIHSARQHGDLAEGTPLRAIADKLEGTLEKFGVRRVGEVGDVFDPNVHEALMHMPADAPGVELPEGTTEMTVVQVIQPGFVVNDKVVRPARVAVADPA
ncbi:nucleotide exchange factor GrpE [Ornithinimicrobium humiphilum]|uniref:Protein GrpE n=1 Tax=Ornithinimicrobium humiphilum TaxID=125288 RepID=A0A543KK32_9MICO|nr:nucleotide exchange factor GrpE [Ornithinimicrobium humiphilum]TQM95439.1 molecular chaperone GrpE [Ornithinimicrobium humiphilum]